MEQESMMNSNVALHPWGFLKTLLISYVLTALLLGGLAFLMYRAKLGATEAAWGVMVIYLVACAVGGFLTGRRVGTQRLLWGLLSGVLYFVTKLFKNVGSPSFGTLNYVNEWWLFLIQARR